MPQQVLIIDDSPEVQALLAARLKSEPVALHFAGGGAEGLAAARQLLPDLILLDVDMPAPNGFEVCRLLKLDETLLNIPIVLMTGSATTADKLRGLELGAMDYITKPFDPAELRARLRAALRMKFMIDLLAAKGQIDALTGLWNRRYFDQRLQSEISLAARFNRPLAVILLDVDHLKTVNDQDGHPAGDEVLKRIAALLIQSVRTEDIVCRYAGEVFAIITPNVAAGAAELAERLHVAISHTVFPHGRKITASVGVAGDAAYPNQSLILRAANALTSAKRQGSGLQVDMDSGTLAATPAA